MYDHMDDQFVGPCELEFTNGNKRLVTLKRTIIDSNARPIYFESIVGEIYLAQNVISVRKV